MIIIEQNITNKISLPLLEYFKPIDLNNMIAAEVTFGTENTQKRMLWYSYDRSKSTMTLDKSTNTLNISLVPNNSWKYQIPVQIRVKDKSGNIKGGNVFYAYIKPTLSAEEF